MAKVSLPNNLEAEKTVLGSCLVDDHAASLVMSSLPESSFSGDDKRNVLIFRAMKELYERRQPIDPQTLINLLQTTQALEDAGGSPYIAELIDSALNPDNVEYYIKIVKDQALLREYLVAVDKIKGAYANGDVKDIGEFVSSTSQGLADIAAKRQVGSFKPINEVAKVVERKIESQNWNNNRGITGVDTGYNRLNKYTHGWQKGDLIILGARPSVGKTAFGLNLIYHAAKYKNQSVAFFSCEMSSEQILMRMISAVSSVSGDALQTGDLTNADKEKVASAIEDLSKYNIYFDDTPNPMLGDIVAKSRKLKAAHPDLCMIVIDYLNIINVERHYERRDLEIAQITRTLKELARSLQVPVLCLAQLNRPTDENTGGVPNLSNLKESSAIEADADIVMLMSRSDYYTNMGQQKGKDKAGNSEYGQKVQMEVDQAKQSGANAGDVSVTNIGVAKNRNGKTGVCILLFSKSYSRFDNPSLSMEKQYKETKGLNIHLDDD